MSIKAPKKMSPLKTITVAATLILAVPTLWSGTVLMVTIGTLPAKVASLETKVDEMNLRLARIESAINGPDLPPATNPNPNAQPRQRGGLSGTNRPVLASNQRPVVISQ